jgi:hypothetical protein
MSLDIPAELRPHGDTQDPRMLTHVLYALHTVT